MFRKFLNPDNALMITMTQITDCIFLSIFWLLGCIPVVTIGTSFAALYDATYRGFRRGEKHCWGRFLQVYRDNWKAGILPTVVFLAAAAALTEPSAANQASSRAMNSRICGVVQPGKSRRR